VKKNIAILISGRGSNMEAIIKNALQGILSDVCNISVVIANNAEALGLNIAAQYGIPTACVLSKGKTRCDFEKELIVCLQEYHIDVVVLAGFMRILSPYFVVRFPQRIINIHPADPNQYRGMHGYQWAYDNHLESTKVTVHYVEEGVDTGAVIASADVDLHGCSSLEEVEKRGLKIEHEFYSKVLKGILME